MLARRDWAVLFAYRELLMESYLLRSENALSFGIGRMGNEIDTQYHDAWNKDDLTPSRDQKTPLLRQATKMPSSILRGVKVPCQA